MRVDVTDTHTALLDAAEVSFVRRGIDGASLRSIMRQASANPAAVHYHFGSREDLVGAVLDRILQPINLRRVELLAELGANVAEIDALAESLVRPDVEALAHLAQRNPDGAGVIGQIYARPNLFVKARVEQAFEPVAAAFMPHLVRALTHLDPVDIAWRIRWGLFGAVGAVLNADGQDLDHHLADLDATVERLVVFIGAGLMAPAHRGGSK